MSVTNYIWAFFSTIKTMALCSSLLASLRQQQSPAAWGETLFAAWNTAIVQISHNSLIYRLHLLYFTCYSSPKFIRSFFGFSFITNLAGKDRLPGHLKTSRMSEHPDFGPVTLCHPVIQDPPPFGLTIFKPRMLMMNYLSVDTIIHSGNFTSCSFGTE